jgi:aminoglycoside phosphotransferase (APT) family kinase protein
VTVTEEHAVNGDDEAARARERSDVWNARRAVAAEADREAEALSRRRSARLEEERRSVVRDGALGNLVLAVAGLIVALLIFERIRIGGQASDCLEGSRRLHQYNCAASLTRSFWFWLIPGDDAELLRATAALNR